MPPRKGPSSSQEVPPSAAVAALARQPIPAPPPTRSAPLWDGPDDSGPNGGITFSLLSRFLCCRERFRLKVVEGLAPADSFNHRIEYGNMWHICEEAKANGGQDWGLRLTAYCQSLAKKYPTAIDQITKWMRVCKLQFPVYLDYWKDHDDEKERTPLLQEVSFKVPYRLPSGREVCLRGKWDAVDVIGKGRNAAIYLQENKTKGDVDEGQLKRQLTFDLQVMLYLTALLSHQVERSHAHDKQWNLPIAGVRYNVIRRPLSGGKGTIKQTKNETEAEYYDRLNQYFLAEPGSYFWRWRVEVSSEDVLKFRHTCLDPILENLCSWWGCLTQCAGEPFELCKKHGSSHWRHPFGVFNPMDSGVESDLDEYLHSGSTAGLERSTNLFPEL